MEAVKAIPRDNPSMTRHRSSWAAADAALEFGRFRVLLRQRQLVADGVPIELGTRAFDLLLVLLEADGGLVTKDELMSRVWPGIVVAEENLKVQISALRKAFAEDRDFIRTEVGRLSTHYHSSLDGRPECLSAPDAWRRPVASKLGSPMDFSTPAARLVCPAVTLADALIQLTPRAPRLAGTSETGYGAACLRSGRLDYTATRSSNSRR